MTDTTNPADQAELDRQTVLLEVGADGVAILTLNRPERKNSWNPVMEKRFYELLDEVDHDPRVRVAILTGSGNSFCPGVDSQRLDSVAGGPMDLGGRTSPSFTFAFRKPLIAAINGGCAGIGLVQALMCDVRFVARGARFSTAFVRRGLAGEYGVTWLLPRIVGTERALDLLLSGRLFDADEALRLGMVSHVVDPDELLAAARAYARDLAANCSPTSMALLKHQVITDLDAPYAVAMERAYRAMAFTSPRDDFREGIGSFMERRTPNFAALPDDVSPSEVTGAQIEALKVEALPA